MILASACSIQCLNMDLEGRRRTAEREMTDNLRSRLQGRTGGKAQVEADLELTIATAEPLTQPHPARAPTYLALSNCIIAARPLLSHKSPK